MKAKQIKFTFLFKKKKKKKKKKKQKSRKINNTLKVTCFPFYHNQFVSALNVLHIQREDHLLIKSI